MGQFQSFMRDILRVLDAGNVGVRVTKAQHYARNDASEQRDDIGYFEVLTARNATGGFTYKQLSEEKSALHQFGAGHENNSKWVSVDGEREEYVFKYNGSYLTGQFALLSVDADLVSASLYFALSHQNLGTYNFRPSGDYLGHLALDIYPWILWGNTEYDATRWTRDQRLDAFLGSIGVAAYSSVEDTVGAIGTAYESAVNSFKKLLGLGTDDSFVGTDEVQRFVGKGGLDTVSYAAAPGGVTVSLERSTQDGQGFDGWARGDTFFGIENLVGSGFGDILIGNRLNNRLEGGVGRDILSGNGGNDTLIGGTGPDTIFGGGGDDTILIADELDEIFGGAGLDTLITPLQSFYINRQTIEGVEIFKLADIATAKHIIGTDRDETLVGNAGENTLRGAGGNDILSGEGGDDGLEGGKGNDIYAFKGDWGADTLSEEGGRDVLIFEDRALADLRIAKDIGVNGGHLKIYDTLTDSSIFAWNHFIYQTWAFEELKTTDGTLDLKKGLPFTGTNGYDAMGGTKYGDLIQTKGGDDHIRGYGGQDTLIGGTGDDYLWGGNGNDTFIFEAGFGHDVVSEAGRYLGEIDSGGDTIELHGISRASVVAELDTQGRMTISVMGFGGVATDTIFIPGQTSNHGKGRLVEWISFDGGAKEALTEFGILG